MYDVIVIGGGQAGLAAGYHLQRAGLAYLILEASDCAAGSWPSYYESLKLFSPAAYSSLPGMRFPGRPDHYPTRDEVIAYLTEYADRFQLPIVTGAYVQQVARHGSGFRVVTADGTAYSTQNVIAATGSFSRPYMPEFPGQNAYQGNILHSSAYQRPTSFEGQRVVVVGSGNSAVQIAVELAQTAQVTLTSRKPVHFIRQRILGKDVHFWLWLTGLDARPAQPDPQGRHVLDAGIYRQALAVGKPDWKPVFSSFTQNGVVWADGREEKVDSVIMATGFSPNLSFLSGLGSLDAEGNALHDQGVSLTTPGLYYVGLSNQRSHASATLRGVGRDARYVIQHILKEVKQPISERLQCCTLQAAT